MEKTAQSCWRQVWRSQFHSSWEEKVFAEDASGLLGGCIWPPRSYSCSFCTREFRSAQALGGHMNVHRRDRARLKQSLSTSNGETETLHEIIPPSLSPSRVSADLSSKENFVDRNLVGEDQKGCESTMSWGHYLGFAVEKCGKEEDRSLYFRNDQEKIVESGSFQPGQIRSTGSCGNEAISCKRLKTADDTPRQQNDQVIDRLNTDCNSAEDLDLELRLGDPPANFNQTV